MRKLTKKERFQEKVLSKFHIYNSIFSTLPYENIADIGQLLPLFNDVCNNGYKKNKDPKSIVNEFFEKYCSDFSEEDKISLLFNFIQYVERQVVLFDAIEDAAFSEINNMDGVGTLRNLKESVESSNKKVELKKYLKRFKIRPVLTAHPTQFYPGSVLGIITDLSSAVRSNDLTKIKNLLSQLGITPFFKTKKPTPYDEAVSLSWYLENVFYSSISNIFKYIKSNIFNNDFEYYDLVSLGFWPGGDRDGNPFVTTDITIKTSQKLRSDIIKNYYRDIRDLRRRLTFKGIEDVIIKIEDDLYRSIFETHKKPRISLEDLVEKLELIRNEIIEKHNSLFLDKLDNFIDKIKIFGYHFATLDIRQDSRIHSKVFYEIFKKALKNKFPKDYASLKESQKIKVLDKIQNIELSGDDFNDTIVKNTIESIIAMKTIQNSNGEKACHRYIISNNQSAVNILEVFSMFKLCGWTELTVDVVPLFETIDDLNVCKDVMETVYKNKKYRNHLEKRGNVQTIMLGFSDGTKDGGYLTANWSILKAKESLTKISRKYGIKVIFFDGRGGPPARGGGNTHQFYSALGNLVESEQIQLTVQGQTISSNFGTIDSSQYNLEQLISSGVKNKIISDKEIFTGSHRRTLNKLSEISYKSYSDFKSHPKFVPYLEHMSTVKYYAKTNIGSRPSKRTNDDVFSFESLRAIPFVGSWSQLKQNVPGFFGLGTAINYFHENKRLSEVKKLYKEVPFFRALVSNSMMSLTKSFFQLTSYMKDDPEFGAFWEIIHDEYLLTKKMLLKVSGFTELMQNEPANKLSIQTRENIVLPLITIQQFALQNIKELNTGKNNGKKIHVYEKMVMRSLFGNINASRNSA